MASVNLSAQAYWTPDPTFTSYLNYGAGISEVSLNLIEKASKCISSQIVQLHFW
jgi:indole-3-acetaldehyde oxidase